MHQWGGFKSAEGVGVEGPRHPKLGYVAVVDLIQRAETGFGVIMAIGEPIGILRGICERGAVLGVEWKTGQGTGEQKAKRKHGPCAREHGENLRL